ncbi:hypothetical protein SAY86_025439 [Trapa natans]|uniref:Integrator complex subunit 4/Protein SIEL C-terminal Ig-like domain-containing protein n=1 Tax=Trapa natans TaxID=22666 RepID=A0AAN7RCC8_TRANT|nr:hypothetical protein SAY86_025439 [Trapa natans]
MEQPATSSGEPSQASSADASDETLTRHTLTSLRSLIINPSSPVSLINSILETLTRHLRLSRDSLILHHILSLLAELAHRSPDRSAVIFQAVRSFSLSTESPPLAAESLDTLASISENEEICDGSFFVSLCFDSLPPSRLWLLKNAGRFRVRPYLLFTVFLGFTRDPYPYVRKAALDGLISLSRSGAIEDHSLIKGCYHRAVELSGDSEACVRVAAVQTVSEWGQMLAASAHGMDRMKWSNEVFIKLCSMARDMRVDVRVAAFNAIEKTKMVSVGLLLQTLSKKVLDIMKESNYPGQGSREQKEAFAFSGALVHGLEDEYHEVRDAACCSMQKLTALSSQFSGEAINLLTDMLNDDSMAVRLHALETMQMMANRGHLSLKVLHMHMFLGSLTDSSSLIRDAVRQVLKSVKLQNMELFRLSVYGLIESMKSYHQDEIKNLSVLFNLGRNHGRFTESLITKVFNEIEPASDGKLGFDNARVSAFLMLAIAAPLCHVKNRCKIPVPIFSYAVTMLGRISSALVDEADQDTLLAYLTHCSRSSNDHEMHSGNLLPSHAKVQLEADCQLLKSMNDMFSKMGSIWSAVKLGHINKGLRTLRVCKGELAILASEPSGISASVAFAEQYLRIVKLLSKIYIHFLPTVNYCNYRVGNLDLLLVKLERRLRDIRHQFIGQPKEELHILELILFSYVVKLLLPEICCCEITMRKLSAVLFQVEHLQEEACMKPSSFVSELEKITASTPCHPSLLRKAFSHFSLEKFELSGRLEYASAELTVPGNNSENPLYFVCGMPVAIPIKVKLGSIPRQRRLWLKMTIGEEPTEFLYLDTKLYADSTRFSYSAPFYRTPKVLSFTLRISIGMECMSEIIDAASRCGGPRYELTFLTPEMDAYLSSEKSIHSLGTGV